MPHFHLGRPAQLTGDAFEFLIQLMGSRRIVAAVEVLVEAAQSVATVAAYYTRCGATGTRPLLENSRANLLQALIPGYCVSSASGSHTEAQRGAQNDQCQCLRHHHSFERAITRS